MKTCSDRECVDAYICCATADRGAGDGRREELGKLAALDVPLVSAPGQA